MIYPTTNICVQISREPAVVYAYVADLNNLPRWATTFCRSIRREDEKWVMETSLGMMAIRLAPENDLGVLDHYQVTEKSLRVRYTDRSTDSFFRAAHHEGEMT